MDKLELITKISREIAVLSRELVEFDNVNLRDRGGILKPVMIYKIENNRKKNLKR